MKIKPEGMYVVSGEVLARLEKCTAAGQSLGAFEMIQAGQAVTEDATDISEGLWTVEIAEPGTDFYWIVDVYSDESQLPDLEAEDPPHYDDNYEYRIGWIELDGGERGDSTAPVRVRLEPLLDYITRECFDPMHGFGGPLVDFVVSVNPLMDTIAKITGMTPEELGKLYDEARRRVHGVDVIAKCDAPPDGVGRVEPGERCACQADDFKEPWWCNMHERGGNVVKPPTENPHDPGRAGNEMGQ